MAHPSFGSSTKSIHIHISLPNSRFEFFTRMISESDGCNRMQCIFCRPRKRCCGRRQRVVGYSDLWDYPEHGHTRDVKRSVFSGARGSHCCNLRQYSLWFSAFVPLGIVRNPLYFLLFYSYLYMYYLF